MRPLVIAGSLLVLSSAYAAGASADVVELKSGERVEGTLRQADQATVTVDVGGQAITFKAEQVRSIHYGSAPAPGSPTSSPPGVDALKALKGLQSVTASGVNYSEYSRRVLDARVVVDQYLQSAAGSRGAGPAIASALHYYEVASAAWNLRMVKMDMKDFQEAARLGVALESGDPALGACQGVRPLVEAGSQKASSMGRTDVNRSYLIGLEAVYGGQTALWACASAQIAEAERLLEGEKK